MDRSNRANIELLFPIPVMFNHLNRDFTKNELKFIKSHSVKTYQNMGNVTSIDNYILNNDELKDLKDFIQDQIEYYINTVYKPRYTIKPYITQSWLNWTKTGEYHHTHEHPNSFVSGVLYINANEKEDKIKFHKSGYQQINIESNHYDNLNSKSWWFNVKTGRIVIFPSSLTHNVDQVTSGDVRISLAFNTFLKGICGDNKSLTELINV